MTYQPRAKPWGARAPKGRDIPAQGEALGEHEEIGSGADRRAHGPLHAELRTTPAGRALLAVGLLFLAAGVAVHGWTLVLWGELLLAFLLLARLRAQGLRQALEQAQVSLALRLAPARSRPALRAGQPVPLQLELLSSLSRPRPIELELRLSPGLGLPEGDPATRSFTLPPGRWLGQVSVVPLRMGASVVQGARLAAPCGAGLFAASVYWPVELRLALLECRPAVRRPSTERPPRALQDRTGAHRLRLAGFGSEFKELREHRPGDAFRSIEWKASARHRRLMVREVESEVVLTLTVLLDISPSMRQGPPGHSLLDRAAALVLGLARAAESAQDRFGLVTYDQRVFGEIRPGAGQAQRRRIAAHLGELFQVVDHDLTAVSPAALVPCVADQLRSRLGIDVGPAVAEWDGEPPRPLLAAVEQVLQLYPPPPRAWLELPNPAPSRSEAQLRLCCQALAIPLPYRPREAPHEGATGLAAALQRITATSRAGQRVLVVSDLEGEKGDAELRRAIGLARSRCLHLLVLHARPAQMLSRPAPPQAALLHDLLAGDRLRGSKRLDLLRTLRVPVLAWEPGETGESLYARLGQPAGFRRRIARPGTKPGLEA